MDHFIGFLNSIEYKNPKLIDVFKQAFLESVEEVKPRDYGAGILFVCPSTKKVLLLLRAEGGEDANVWCSLGGKGELGETPMETAVREVWEEGQIGPKQYKLVEEPLRINQNTPTFKFITYLGLVDQEFSPVINYEHTDAKWFSFDEIWQIPLHYGIKAIFTDEKNKNFINKYLG